MQSLSQNASHLSARGCRAQTGLSAKTGSGLRPARSVTARQRSVEVTAAAHKQGLDALVGAASPALAGLVAAAALAASPALAIDSVKVGTCLLQNCQLELAGCIADEKCAESLVCLNKCNGRPDEADCQIRCGDLYSDQAIATFNTCAVTQKKCVPQIPDDGSIKLPEKEALVPDFNPVDFQGRWFISSGLNKDFDIFDCQEHFFTSPGPGELYGKLNWRVKKTNGQFYERSDVQTFKQDESTPAILYNHDNEFLHYQDDWYILAQKPEEYVLVFYRGSNDAWDGYGGAVVYTRDRDLKPEFYPELTEAAARAGLDFSQFTPVDNKCGPQPPLMLTRPTDLDTLFDDVIAVEKAIVNEVVLVEEGLVGLEKGIEKTIEDDIVSFSRGFTLLKGKATETVKPRMVITRADERAMDEKASDVAEAERMLDAMQDKMEEMEKNKGPFGFFRKLFS